MVARLSMASQSGALLPGNVAYRVFTAGPGVALDTSFTFSGLEAAFGTISAGMKFTIRASFQNLKCDRSAEQIITGSVT
jgi:hypothetical protein